MHMFQMSCNNFPSWIMTGESQDAAPCLNKRVELSSDNSTHQRVLSLSQDIIYCTTKGRIKPPKHIALPVALKHLTGSEKVVIPLNRLGHGISQSQLSEWDAATAEKQIQAQQLQAAFIPSDISRMSYVTFCWDSNDILQETPSGRGTTHCTNGIAVQRQVFTFSPPPTDANGKHTPAQMQTSHKRQRSIQPMADFQLEYNAGRRHGPPLATWLLPSTLQPVADSLFAKNDFFNALLLVCGTRTVMHLDKKSRGPQAGQVSMRWLSARQLFVEV